jgi:hypothetical protein
MRVAVGVLPGVDDVGGDGVDADGVFDLGEDDGPLAAHAAGVAGHDVEVGADGGGEVGLVDDQEVALGEAGAAFARDLVAAGDVDDLDREVGEFAAEAGGEVVAAGLDEEEVGAELAMEIFEREEVGGDVLADGGMGAAAGFDGADAGGVEGPVVDQEFAVFAGEDVVGDGGQCEAIAQVAAELEHERGFPAADRAADADGEGAAGEVAGPGLVAEVEVSGMIEVLVGVSRAAVRMGVMMGMGMRMRMVVGVRVIVIVAVIVIVFVFVTVGVFVGRVGRRRHGRGAVGSGRWAM